MLLSRTWFVIFPWGELDLETSGLYFRNVGTKWHPTISAATRKIVVAPMAGNQNYPDGGNGHEKSRSLELARCSKPKKLTIMELWTQYGTYCRPCIYIYHGMFGGFLSG
ncbi:uncharacterized protein LOC113282307 [Papaver somniferum]|uniref:uncharacterized protein LOC113282307 n=1 Tax=Papaver somniferum TaxID=3469 RepID=UPI000E7039F8|nr:uncharacterized protein LOC113282307 [Papaver somniferum]